MPSYHPQEKLRVRVSGSAPAVRAFLRTHPPACERLEQTPDGLAIEATIEASMQRELEDAKLDVEVLYVIAQRMQEMVRDMGTANRFAGGKRLRGLGARGKDAA